MIAKLGFLVNNLGPTQYNYHLINGLNKFVSKRHDLDPIVFYENLVESCLPTSFMCLQSAELYGYEGVAIANTFQGAKKLLACHFPVRKYFYVWDLEWVGGQVRNFDDWYSVYANPEIRLIVRGESHKLAIENAWNRQISAIVDDVNIEQLAKAIYESIC